MTKRKTYNRARDTRRELPTVAPAAASSAFGSMAEQISADLAVLTQRTVNERTLRGLPAADFAVNRIANAVASMSPLCVYEGDEITKRSPTPLVAHRPLATVGTFDFWHLAISTAVRRGNFVGLLADFDASGWARQVVPVDPGLVGCFVDEDGFTVYEIQGTRFSTADVVHVRGPHTAPGQPWALSPIEVFRTAIGEASTVQDYGSNSFASGSVPSAVISLDRNEVPEAVARQVQGDWIARHGNGQRRPAVVPKTMSITPLSWSPHDAEFIEAKKLSLAEMAMVLGLHPSDLGVSLGGESMTYANISDRQNERIIDTYGPWMRRFEEAWSDLIPGDAHCRFEAERVLRLNPKERAEIQAIRITSGVSTPDEEREAEGKPPLPKQEVPAMVAPVENPADPVTTTEDPA